MAKAAKAQIGETILSIKVTLRDLKPPIWRRLLVSEAMTLGDLHLVIQAAMGWGGGHMHAFDIDGRQYGERDSLEDVADEDRMSLRKLVKSGVSKFTYIYDFGDDWDHLIVVEKGVPAVAGQAYPTCITGKRHCPPDDCGGAPGYESLLEILADPNHPEHAEQREWVGEDLDPEAFSIEEANQRLASFFRPA